MESMSWFVPILPGKLDTWKAFTEESKRRADEHARSRKRAGITREVASLVQTPQGDFTSVFLEGEDIARAFKTMAASDDPYDVWFMKSTAEVHGMTQEMWEGGVPSTVYFDYRDEEGERAARRMETGKMSTDTD